MFKLIAFVLSSLFATSVAFAQAGPGYVSG